MLYEVITDLAVLVFLIGLEGHKVVVQIVRVFDALQFCRITSYNVCYTKLLRVGDALLGDYAKALKFMADLDGNIKLDIGELRSGRDVMRNNFV